MQYNPSGDEWYKPTIFYIIDINGIVKFGITSNWELRLRAYKKEVGNVPFTIIKKDNYDRRWKAELLEQVIKWRLRRLCINGRHEWIDAPIPVVVNCYFDTCENILPEINRHFHIHKKDKDRWDHYKQLVDNMFYKDFKPFVE